MVPSAPYLTRSIRAGAVIPFGDINEIILAMYGTDRIGHGRLAVRTVLLRVADRRLQIPGIVERVKHADDVDPVLDGLFAERFHNVAST